MCERKYASIKKDPTLNNKAKSLTFNQHYGQRALVDDNNNTLKKEYGQRPQKYFAALIGAYKLIGPDSNPWECFWKDLKDEVGNNLDDLFCIDIAQEKVESVYNAFIQLTQVGCKAP